MAVTKLPYERNTRVTFCTTIANKNAPTVSELNAGANLSEFCKKDGIAPPTGQNYIDSADITTNFDSQEVGSWGGAPLNLTMFRATAPSPDTAWNLMVYGTRGFIVISRKLGASAVQSIVGDKVEVWPVSMHEPVMNNTAANDNQTFTAGFAVTDAPAMRATVA